MTAAARMTPTMRPTCELPSEPGPTSELSPEFVDKQYRKAYQTGTQKLPLFSLTHMSNIKREKEARTSDRWQGSDSKKRDRYCPSSFFSESIQLYNQGL